MESKLDGSAFEGTSNRLHVTLHFIANKLIDMYEVDIEKKKRPDKN